MSSRPASADEVLDLRRAVLGALAEPDRAHLRERADRLRQALADREDAGNGGGGDGAQADEQDAEFAGGGRDFYRCFHSENISRRPARPGRAGEPAIMAACSSSSSANPQIDPLQVVDDRREDGREVRARGLRRSGAAGRARREGRPEWRRRGGALRRAIRPCSRDARPGAKGSCSSRASRATASCPFDDGVLRHGRRGRHPRRLRESRAGAARGGARQRAIACCARAAASRSSKASAAPGRFAKATVRPAGYDAVASLETAGYRPVRVLAEVTNFRFVEGLKV